MLTLSPADPSHSEPKEERRFPDDLVDRPASAVSARTGDAVARRVTVRDRQGSPHRQPAWPYRSALVRAERAVPRPGATADRPRPLYLQDAVQPGHSP